MANLRDIRVRIKSVKNTKQITRAMQLVAASKMKKAQDQAVSGRAYTRLLTQIVATVAQREDAKKIPIFQEREVKQRGVLVITSDKGLCGGLNGNIFRQITKMKDDNITFFSVGRKGKQFLSRSKRNLNSAYEVSDNVKFSEVRPILESMLKKFNEGELDTIEVLYPQFVNTLIQAPKLVSVFPLTNLEDMLAELSEDEQLPDDSRDMLFEPSVAEIVEELPALFAKQKVYQLILESKASEHSARMVAMKSATDNAGKLIDSLTLDYNKARQAAITQEILELAAS